MSRLNFDYTDPYPNFDRNKIKGYVAQLTSLEKNHYNKATALEVAAGAKLFNVIVEDEQVGNQLLKNGRLKKRVTMIPLTKIKSYSIPQQVRRFLQCNHCNIHYSYITNKIENRYCPTCRSWKSPFRNLPRRLSGGGRQSNDLCLRRNIHL